VYLAEMRAKRSPLHHTYSAVRTWYYATFANSGKSVPRAVRSVALLRIRLHDPESVILPGNLDAMLSRVEVCHEAVVIVEPDVAVAATPRQHGHHCAALPPPC
jgi:hypothetical protein